MEIKPPLLSLSTWWNSSMSISASAFQDFSSGANRRGRRFSRAEKWGKDKQSSHYLKLPEMVSWKMTLVSFKKFLPMMKTSSPPLTEQLCNDFLRISGIPAGWAATTQTITLYCHNSSSAYFPFNTKHFLQHFLCIVFSSFLSSSL